MKTINFILLMLISTMVQSSDLAGKTRSAGKMTNNNSIVINEQLQQVNVRETGDNLRLKSDTSLYSPQLTYTANHPSGVDFELFDAWIMLTGDLDNDGFFHRMKVSFDADVNTDTETVYAKIYLSHEGGNWFQAAESDLFEIHSNSAEDSYEIVTELVEGYPPGYYEVLIELHSLFHPGIVANRTLSLDMEGYSLALEDQQYDSQLKESYYYETEVYGSGSISILGLLMLAGLILIKLRYFSSHK